jgi:hypothetical protein
LGLKTYKDLWLKINVQPCPLQTYIKILESQLSSLLSITFPSFDELIGQNVSSKLNSVHFQSTYQLNAVLYTFFDK